MLISLCFSPSQKSEAWQRIFMGELWASHQAYFVVGWGASEILLFQISPGILAFRNPWSSFPQRTRAFQFFSVLFPIFLRSLIWYPSLNCLCFPPLTHDWSIAESWKSVLGVTKYRTGNFSTTVLQGGAFPLCCKKSLSSEWRPPWLSAGSPWPWHL